MSDFADHLCADMTRYCRAQIAECAGRSNNDEAIVGVLFKPAG
jgi:hypothetical protein